MAKGSSSEVRAATRDDVRFVAACLTSALYDDPVWGLWAFPEESSRAQRLFEFMRFFTLAGVRHPWVRTTEGAKAVAVWLPPGVPEFTTEEETAFEPLLHSLFGKRADEANELFTQTVDELKRRGVQPIDAKGKDKLDSR